MFGSVPTPFPSVVLYLCVCIRRLFLFFPLSHRTCRFLNVPMFSLPPTFVLRVEKRLFYAGVNILMFYVLCRCHAEG